MQELRRRSSFNTTSIAAAEIDSKQAVPRRYSFAAGDDVTDRSARPLRRNSSFSGQRRGSRQEQSNWEASSNAVAAAAAAATATTTFTDASGSSFSSKANTNLSLSEEEREKQIVQATMARRQRNKGRSIESVLKTPRRSGGEAEAERGPSLLTQHIVLGGRDEANNRECLEKLGVSHILNVASSSLPNSFEDSFVYLSIPLHDSDEQNILNYIPKVRAFLRRVEDLNGRCLVHCVSGISRSVSVCILHFVMEHKMPLKYAYSYIYSCRPFICPNDNFKLQMAEAELSALRFSSICGPDAGKEWDFYEWNTRKQTVHQKQLTSGSTLGSTRRKPTSSNSTSSNDCCLIS